MSSKTASDIGRTEQDVLAYHDFVERHQFSLIGTHKIPIKKGRTVLGVRARVIEAFDGTTPVAKVGDAADDDGFLLTTDVDITAVNAFANSVGLGTNAYAKGKHFAATSVLNVIITGAGNTVGTLEVSVVYAGYTGADPAWVI